MTESEQYRRLTREGLTAYFSQSDQDNDGRVDWDIDILVTIILTMEQEAYAAGRADRKAHGRAAWARARMGHTIMMPLKDNRPGAAIGHDTRREEYDDWQVEEQQREGE